MTPNLFGLEMVDVLADGWEQVAHLAIGEVRTDGSIDILLLLESGTLRYMVTIEGNDATETVPAPAPYQHLARFTRQVLAENTPIIRRPSSEPEGFLLSVFPVQGHQKRVVYILDPAATTPPFGSSRVSDAT